MRSGLNLLAVLLLTGAITARAASFVLTQPAAPITSASAMLNGAALPNGQPSTAWFEWGTNSAYGQVTSPVNVGGGFSLVRVQATLSLAAGTAYQFRLVISNASGVISPGQPLRFITGGRATAWGDNSHGQINIPVGWRDIVSVAAGASHSVVLKADGSLAAVGRFFGTGSNMPPALSNVVAIAAGSDHDLALRADGTVVAWGDNYDRQATVPPDLTGVIAVAGGGSHSLALKPDGTVRAWGDNYFGQSSVPAGLSNVVAIAAGAIHSLALQADGTVVYWGRYNDGGAGVPPWISNVVAIAAGPDQDLIVTTAGQVMSWGITFSRGVTNLPVPADFTNCLAIATGVGYSLALNADGTVEAWGLQNGLRETTVPGGLANAVAIAAGAGHKLALAPNVPPVALPQVLTAPINLDFPLALMATDFDQDPIAFRIATIPAAGALYQYANGSRGAPITQPNTAVTDASGRVILAPAPEGFGVPYTSFTFIANDGQADSAPATVTINLIGPTSAATQLPGPVRSTTATLNGMCVAGNLPATAWFEWGTTTTYSQSTSTQSIPASGNVLHVSATISNLAANAIYHCRLIVTNAGGTAYGADQIFTTGRKVTPWGSDNSAGQLQLPPGLSNTVAIAAGGSQSLALDANGSITAWGDYYGETPVPWDLSNVTAIAAGSVHSLALKADGTVAAWGYGPNGETNVPAGLSNVVTIAAATYFNLALRADGTVVGWGWNGYDQTNILATNNNVIAIAAGQYRCVLLKADRTVFEWPVIYPMPLGLKDVIAISAGDSHTLALKNDGTVVAWGWNGYGQTNVPPGLTNVIAIAAANDSSLALKNDGTIVGWGENSFNQTKPPAGLSFASAIALGNAHGLALANAPAVAQAQTNVGAAEHDLTISLHGTEPNNDPLQYQITSLPAAGRLYQFTSAGRGWAITAPNMPVQDLSGRLIFAPDPGGRGNPYTAFTYAAGDGEAAFSAQATVTVSLLVSPYAVTRAAFPVTRTNATLNATVVPNAFPTTAWFEWGTDASLGQRTAPIDLGSGNFLQNISAAVTGLSSNSVYRFQLVISNSLGVTRTATRLFTTGSKAMAWGYPSIMQMYLGDLTAVAVGTDHALVLKPDGTVAQWGYGSFSVPPVSNVAAIAAAGSNSLALIANGAVVAWGDNRYGQATVPADLTNAVQIACGETHSLALRSDGTVAAWGNNSSRQCAVPADLNNVAELAGGNGFSLALLADGTVRTWGYGISPQVPPALSNVVSVAAGAGHALALLADGTVSAWGYDASGAATVPVGLSNVVAIATTSSNSLALRFDGTIVAWGDKSRSQVSLAASFTNVAAIAIGPLQPMLLQPNSPPSVSPRTYITLANQDFVLTPPNSDPDYDQLTLRISSLPAIGNLYQYSGSGRGPLISAPNTPITDYFGRLIYTPATNGFGVPYDSFSVFADDGEAACAAATLTISIPAPLYAASQRPSSVSTTSADLNGMVFASGLPTAAWFEWGQGNGFGQATSPTYLVASPKLARVTASLSGLVPNTSYHYRIVASNAASVVRGAGQRFRPGGKVTTWGLSSYNLTNIPPGLSNVVSVAAGASFNLAVLTDGTIRAWGGDPNYAKVATNVPPGLTNIIAATAGRTHTVALRADGTVTNWGGYQYSPTAVTNMPGNLSNVVAIAAGTLHTLALRRDGTIVPWGDNSYSQTNVPYGLSNAVAVAAGAYHNLALLIDGTVVGWGNNSDGQRTVPAMTNVVAVAGGLNHSLALKNNGTVLAWGNNSYGQTNVPAGLTNVVAIAAGYNHSLALKADGTVVAWGSSTYGQTNVPPLLNDVTDFAASTDHSLGVGANLPPSAANLQFSAYPNQDAVITLAATDPNGDALAFRIASLPDRGTLYQYNAGSRGAFISGAGTPVTDPAGRVLFAPVPYALGASSFTFVADDGEAYSVSATVMINLVLPPAPSMAPTACARNPDGTFILRFNGYYKATYSIYASTNLLQWQPLGLATQISFGQFQFLDTQNTNVSQCFYRAGAP
jgi:alpha-tubulin suppressor-like RCC1 family protein